MVRALGEDASECDACHAIIAWNSKFVRHLPYPCAPNRDTAAPVMDDVAYEDAPSAEALYDLVTRFQAQLPDPIRQLAREVGVQITDWPPQDLFLDLQIDDPLELTGLCEGVPLTEKGLVEQALAPDVIWLFRLPITREWQERGNISLAALVTHVYVHELAHHFGWSDEDIAAIDRWWE